MPEMSNSGGEVGGPWTDTRTRRPPAVMCSVLSVSVCPARLAADIGAGRRVQGGMPAAPRPGRRAPLRAGSLDRPRRPVLPPRSGPLGRGGEPSVRIGDGVLVDEVA